MAKNEFAKTVKQPYKENAYEVWQAGDWKWYVLKKYQADDSKPYARAFCLVTSPVVGEEGELGDTYIADYKKVATKIR